MNPMNPKQTDVLNRISILENKLTLKYDSLAKMTDAGTQTGVALVKAEIKAIEKQLKDEHDLLELL